MQTPLVTRDLIAAYISDDCGEPHFNIITRRYEGDEWLCIGGGPVATFDIAGWLSDYQDVAAEMWGAQVDERERIKTENDAVPVEDVKRQVRRTFYAGLGGRL